MKDVKKELEERKKEINEYFDFLQKIEKGDISPNNFAVPAIMRASCILMFYNLLESIVILAIDRIHVFISTQDNLKYQDASDELKKIWIEYKYKNFEDENRGSDKIFQILKNINNDHIKIYDENAKDKTDYLNKVKGVSFSGKIDGKQVKLFAEKYGFEKNKRVEGKKLVQIKHQRNNLAHGEMSFQNCGRNFSFFQIKKFKQETFLFLDEFLNNVDEFLTTKKYKKITYSSYW